jgi:hypothetical protein
MRVIMGALLATLVTACAHAQPAKKLPKLPKDFTETAFRVGQHFGMAEALVKSCDLAVVDPKLRAAFMATFPQNYMDTFEKGFMQGWKLAEENANNIQLPVTAAQKRCLLGMEMYGPKGTVMENLIVRLGEDGKQ